MKRFTKKKVRSRNYLLYGENGVGKTILAQAMAQAASTRDTQWHCALLRVATYTDKYQSSASGYLVKEMKRIRAMNQPCVIVLDELTHITKNYGQENNFNNDAATTVAAEIDTCNERNDIIIVGTTNNKSDIPAILNSRFNKRGTIHIKMPSFDLRLDLIKHLFQNEIQNQALTDSYIEMIAKKTAGKALRDISVDFYQSAIDHAKMREKELAKDQEQSDEEIALLDQDDEYTITQEDIDAVMATWRAWYHPCELWENHKNAVGKGIIKSLPIAIPATIGIAGLVFTIWQFKQHQKATTNQLKEQNRRAEEQAAEHRKEIASAKNFRFWGLVTQGVSVGVSVISHAGPFLIEHKQEIMDGAKKLAGYFVTGTPL